VDVAEVVNAGAAVLEQRMEGQGANRTKFAEHQTSGQPNKLIHVLVNLLQNSLDALRKKFEGEKPTIWIQGRVERRAGAHRHPRQRPGIEQKNIWTRFLTRFSPPRTWARAWGWA
jgi:C4-dicarboxylate-specific signal transduction histidine kinase